MPYWSRLDKKWKSVYNFTYKWSRCKGVSCCKGASYCKSAFNQDHAEICAPSRGEYCKEGPSCSGKGGSGTGGGGVGAGTVGVL